MTMNAQRECRSASRLEFWAQGASLFVILMGALALLGWSLKLPVLQSIYPGLPRMVPNTAISLVLAGLSLWMLRISPLPMNRSNRRPSPPLGEEREETGRFRDSRQDSSIREILTPAL